MEASGKLARDEKSSYVNKMNGWFDHYILQQPLLPQQQPQQQKSRILKSRPFRLLVLVYILFSIFFTATHFSSWLFTTKDTWTYQRSYDACKENSTKKKRVFNLSPTPNSGALFASQ